MPTADLDNSAGWAGWLQSLLQNQGAAQPYGPGGAPAGGAGPQGLMPGGGAMGYQAATPGQPSMGYPAVGQAAGRPSVAPGMQAPAAQNPIMRALNALNPISSAQAQEAEPGVWAMRHGMPDNPDLSGLLRYASGSPGGPGPGPGGPGSAGNDAGYNNPYTAAATANPAQGGPYVGSGPPGVSQPGPAPAGVGGPYVGGQGVTPTPMGQGGIGSDARFPIAGPLAAPASGPMDPSIIARQKLMRPAATPAATSTAPPSAAQSPFTQIQRPNLPASGYSGGDRMMTALNLARLFGRA